MVYQISAGSIWLVTNGRIVVAAYDHDHFWAALEHMRMLGEDQWYLDEHPLRIVPPTFIKTATVKDDLL